MKPVKRRNRRRQRSAAQSQSGPSRAVSAGSVMRNLVAGKRRPRPSVGHSTCHLVDIENLAASASANEDEVAAVTCLYREVAEHLPGDHVIIGSSHFAAKSGNWYGASQGWGCDPRRVTRSGPDGADLALIEVIEREAIAERFDRVVIGSGDGSFSLACHKLRSAGVAVTVVARDRPSLSHRLQIATDDVRLLTA